MVPAATVTGRSPPFAENPCPATVICETPTAADPSFTSETVVLAVCPTGTPPKLIVVVVALRLPVLDPGSMIFPPRHPESKNGKQDESTRRRAESGRRTNTPAQARRCTPQRFSPVKGPNAACSVVNSWSNGTPGGMLRNCVTSRIP